MPLAVDINNILYGGSPYAGFDVAPFPFDLDGWFSDTEIFDGFIDQIRPTLIVEVGSWKGKSSHYLIERAMRHADASIVCVDTWLGSSEHWVHPHWRPMLGIKGANPPAPPTLHEQFIANVIHAGLTERVVPLPLPSRLASIVLERLRQGQASFAPLIFIDGAHDEASVREDISCYWPLVSPGGVMIGDDYVEGAWPGVINAVEAFTAQHADTILEMGRVGARWFARKRFDAPALAPSEMTGAHFGDQLSGLVSNRL
jgi:predicted O-methyltransferase YrrM